MVAQLRKQKRVVFSSSDILAKNALFFEPTRFNIMLFLYQNENAIFTQLQHLLGLTPGNLDYHIRKLEQNCYIRTKKVITNRPLTVVKITKEVYSDF